MRGFLLGVVVACLGFGTYLVWKQRSTPATVSIPADVRPKPAPSREVRKRRRGAARAGNPGGVTASQLLAGSRGGPSSAGAEPAAPDEPEPIRLGPEDLKTVAQGDDLSRPDIVRMDFTDDSGSRELGQDEIDARFRAREDAVLECISRSRPDGETYVPGRVTVKFRIQRSGTVRGVRVEAPAILQKGGLTGCLRRVVGGLRFPPSGASQIVSYPFSLS